MSFSRGNISKHWKKVHFWGKFRCRQCPFTCNFAKDLANHYEEMGHNEEFSKCYHCKDESVPVRDLEAHYRKCVTDWFLKKEREHKEWATSKHVCEECGKEVSGANYLNHCRMHEREKSEDPYQYCDKCEKRFLTAKRLRDHLRVEHEGTLIPCPLCDKKFKRKHALDKHTNIEHSTDDKFQCKHCLCRLGDAWSLQLHMRKHEPPKLKCKYCDRLFKSPGAVTAHEREHTGERPSKCDICGNGFKDNTVLQVHLKNVHKVMKPGWKPILKRVRNKESV